MERLNLKQQHMMHQCLTLMKYDRRRLQFGPESKKYFVEFKNALNAVEVGYHASHVHKTDPSTTSDKEQILIWVDYRQCDKLLAVLSALTGRTYDSLTNGEYSPPERGSSLSLPIADPAKETRQDSKKK